MKFSASFLVKSQTWQCLSVEATFQGTMLSCIPSFKVQMNTLFIQFSCPEMLSVDVMNLFDYRSAARQTLRRFHVRFYFIFFSSRRDKLFAHCIFW